MTATNVVEEITAKAARLPFELQREALDFIEFIAQRTQQRATQPAPNATAGRPAYKSVLGALEHLNVPISLEDLAEVRREMWANFPREDPRE